jgi:uncharacterized lipoprotein YddW (UPF0748 family)
MKKIIPLFVLFSFIPLTGCGNKTPSYAALPPPELAKVPEILQNASCDNDVRKFVRAGLCAEAPKCDSKGVIKLTTDFKSESEVRSYWDLNIPLDLSTSVGVTFDFRADTLAVFSSLEIYFKSGDGWYKGSVAPEVEGEWCRISIKKSDMTFEGKCSGWKNISTIRIAGWGAGSKGKSVWHIANITPIYEPNDVLIVYSDSLAKKRGDRSLLQFAGTFSSTLNAIGIGSSIIADTDLSEESFKGAKAVILPYNPSITSSAASLIKKYVDNGGKLLACYSTPNVVYELFDMKAYNIINPKNKGLKSISGFLRADNSLDCQPEFAPQESWMTATHKYGSAGEVVAWWADSDRKTIGIPSLVKFPKGIYMAHVWLGGVRGASAELMRSIIGYLSPELEGKANAFISRKSADEERARAWLETIPSKKGEYRAFWCHSARGLASCGNWDSSIKFLKENGFNTIIPNLCWGGVAFYKSSVLPLSGDFKREGDAFDQCFEACKKYGVEMHVWKVCWNMSSYASKEFISRMIAEKRCLVNSSGKCFETWLCPSNPKNQSLEISSMIELASKKPHGIHFDYIRYRDDNGCFCEGCRERFEKFSGKKVGKWPDDVYGKTALADLKKEWIQFRISNITTVVKTVSDVVRRDYPGVKISAAVFRNAVSDRINVAQDWADWCEKGYLDSIHHMDYVASPAIFKNVVKKQAEVVKNAKVYPGIGLSCWKGDVLHEVLLARQIMAVRELGLDGFTVFNFDRRAVPVLPLMRLGITKED